MVEVPFSGLSENAEALFEEISCLDCIKSLYLCGGTAVSLQLRHRLSDDFDFELLGTRKDRPRLDVSSITTEIMDKFPQSRRSFLSEDHFEIELPNKVKLSFFRPSNSIPPITVGYSHNNLQVPSLQDLLWMKIFTTSVRNLFRDYYDIYCLLKAGCSLADGVKGACDFSRHTLHTKSLLLPLLVPGLFPKHSDFDTYSPIYDVSAEEIASYIDSVIEQSPSDFLRKKLKR